MAERKRRDDDAADGRLDEVADDDIAVDDDLADDELDSDLDADLVDDDEDEDDEAAEPAKRKLVRSRASGGGTAVSDDDKPKRGPKSRSGKPGDKRPVKKAADKPNILARFANFVREVVAELRKVIWPTRKELLTYTAVVVVFVTIMFTVVAGLDWIFAKGVVAIFGNGTSASK